MELHSGQPVADQQAGLPSGEVPCSASIDWSVWSRSGTSRKYGRQGLTRTVPPSETVRRVAPLMARIGVTRVAEVTHLDRNGVPNFIAARPRDAGNQGISFYNGKGASKSQARASAMMEGIERYSGEFCPQAPIVSSYQGLARNAPAVNPDELIVPRVPNYDPSLPIEWVLGFDLIGRVPTFVPLNSVVCPYTPRQGTALFCTSSNGLASGNTLDEALCQALCEVNERDAVALHDAKTRLKAQVRALIAEMGIPEPGDLSSDGSALIDPATLPLSARRVHGRLVAGGLAVYLRNVTSETGIATFSCMIAEKLGAAYHRAHAGYGCHPDARVAAVRALTEAATSRIACIQGGREDLPEVVKDASFVANPDVVFGGGPTVPMTEVPSIELSTVEEDVDWIVERFHEAGFTQVVAVDLTRPELGVPVVRVVIPHAESWSIFHMHLSSAAIGPRALAMVH
jgi:ribosomal protein S12 methylthiotransferase accessory factor YcaO